MTKKTTRSLVAFSLAWAVCVLVTPLSAAFAASGNADDGEDVYDSVCADCHSLKVGKNKKGPSLSKVVGRAAGTIAGFNYSVPMKTSKITWAPDKLQTYLAAPAKVVPGGKMKLDSPLTAKEVADVVAFLATNP